MKVGRLFYDPTIPLPVPTMRYSRDHPGEFTRLLSLGRPVADVQVSTVSITIRFLTAAAAAFLFFVTAHSVVAQPDPQQAKRTDQQVRLWQEQKGWLKPGGWLAHDTWPETRAQRWSSDHRAWPERGGYGGYLVPAARFTLNFGAQHPFRLAARPIMAMGYPRFEYSGFSFLLVDPWPEYWPDNWYDVNDLYIDYDNGYYLHNRGYAQVRLAILVEL